MPLGPGVKYRVKQTSKGPVRLAFKGDKVVEAKNMKTGAMHTMMTEHFKKKAKGKAKGGGGKFGGKQAPPFGKKKADY